MLPASYRARRRLKWLAAIGLPVVAIVAVVLLIPSHGPPAGTPKGDEGPAQLASAQRKVKLTAADRRQIDAVLDRFLPAAMERKDEALGWSLAGPEMKTSSSLAQWRKGNTPVPYYQAREKTFHDWDPVDVGEGYVIFTLLVHPAKGSTLAPYVFSGEVVKEHGSWLVNRLYTIAIMNQGTKKHPMAEVGPADFGAGGTPAARNSTPDTAGHKSRILVVLAVLALVALIPLTFALVALRRARRWRRRVRSSEQQQLPALPARYRS
jgi:hypothetical protein